VLDKYLFIYERTANRFSKLFEKESVNKAYCIYLQLSEAFTRKERGEKIAQICFMKTYFAAVLHFT